VSHNHRPLPEKPEGYWYSGHPHQTRSRAILGRRFRWNQTSRILLAPFQRLPDDLVFICAGEMPQEPFGGLLVNERGKAGAFWAPPGVQLNHVLLVVDTPLKR
jgi:hypothetical protein